MVITVDLSKRSPFKLPKIQRHHGVITFILCSLCLVIFFQQKADKTSQAENLAIIQSPKINDIYFLDFRLLSDKLRPHQKYRIAKVVDITGDVITLIYGRLLYNNERAAINSIKFGQLRYSGYFESYRYNLTHQEIQAMYENGSIYSAKRPFRKKLYGNFIAPDIKPESTNPLIYGKKENTRGLASLNNLYSEKHLQQAFELFQQSAQLGYAKGQVNLAEMYINGQHVKQNLKQALYWLEQASLQSYKPAILKYGIVCKQVTNCYVNDFYRRIANAGVNIKVRKLATTLR